MIRRRLFAILSAASLLLCVATCTLWVRSYRRDADLARWRMFGDVHVARSARGRLTVYRTPRHARDLPQYAGAALLAGELRNDQVSWEVANVTTMTERKLDKELDKEVVEVIEIRPPVSLHWVAGGPTSALAHLPREATTRLLLDALEDPARIVAAHILLVLCHSLIFG